VFAPMPSAIEMMASAANPGFRRSWRRPKRMSWRSRSMLGARRRACVEDSTTCRLRFAPAEMRCGRVEVWIQETA